MVILSYELSLIGFIEVIHQSPSFNIKQPQYATILKFYIARATEPIIPQD